MLRSYVAGALVFLGGIFILVGGLVLAFVGTVLATVFGFVSAWFLVGVLDGVAVLAVGALLWAWPRAARPLGVVAIALAALSIPFAFGGLVVGFLLTLFGGVFAVGSRRRPIEVQVVSTPGKAPPWG
jgi:hypothetical protein